MEQVQLHGVASIADSVVPRWVTPKFQAHSTRPGPAKAMLLGCSDAGYLAACAALRDSNLRTEIHAIAAPALIILGASDPVMPPSDGRALEAAIFGSSSAKCPVPISQTLRIPTPTTVSSSRFSCGTQTARPSDERRTAPPAWHVDASRRAWRRASRPRFRQIGLPDAGRLPGPHYITCYAWGEIWTRPGLSAPYLQPAQHIAMMVALNRTDELHLHLRAAANNGVSRDEIKEVLLQSAIYCGVPAANQRFTTPRRSSPRWTPKLKKLAIEREPPRTSLDEASPRSGWHRRCGAGGARPRASPASRRHLLRLAGIDSVIIELRSRNCVEGRIRAGFLEHTTVDLLRSAGLGERMDREGVTHSRALDAFYRRQDSQPLHAYSEVQRFSRWIT